MSWKTGPSRDLLDSLLADPDTREQQAKREREERERLCGADRAYADDTCSHFACLHRAHEAALLETQRRKEREERERNERLARDRISKRSAQPVSLYFSTVSPPRRQGAHAGRAA